MTVRLVVPADQIRLPGAGPNEWHDSQERSNTRRPFSGSPMRNEADFARKTRRR